MSQLRRDAGRRAWAPMFGRLDIESINNENEYHYFSGFICPSIRFARRLTAKPGCSRAY